MGKLIIILNSLIPGLIDILIFQLKKKNTINFDENLICDACKVKDKKAKINWELREQELKELCEKFRKNDGTYDCLVPGSGGKDSFMQAHLLKYKYGMNPLTVTWPPILYSEYGLKNFNNSYLSLIPKIDSTSIFCLLFCFKSAFFLITS